MNKIEWKILKTKSNDWLYKWNGEQLLITNMINIWKKYFDIHEIKKSINFMFQDQALDTIKQYLTTILDENLFTPQINPETNVLEIHGKLNMNIIHLECRFQLDQIHNKYLFEQLIYPLMQLVKYQSSGSRNKIKQSKYYTNIFYNEQILNAFKILTKEKEEKEKHIKHSINEQKENKILEENQRRLDYQQKLQQLQLKKPKQQLLI